MVARRISRHDDGAQLSQDSRSGRVARGINLAERPDVDLSLTLVVMFLYCSELDI
jgi:hypothetical protein